MKKQITVLTTSILVAWVVLFSTGCRSDSVKLPGMYTFIESNPPIKGFASTLVLQDNGEFRWITRKGDQDEARGTYTVGDNVIYFEPVSWTASTVPNLRGRVDGNIIVLTLDEKGRSYELKYKK